MEVGQGEARINEDEILLQRCRSAETLEEQERCFEDLAVFLETIETRKSTNDVDSRDNEENDVRITALAARENIARSLLTTWPYGQVSACMDRVLDACGPMISISTSSGLLKEIAASRSDRRHQNQDSSLPLSWTPQTSSLPLRSIVQACWATIQRFLLATTLPPSSPSSSKLGNDQEDEGRQLETQQFVSKIVLLLPQTFANACFAVKLQVPLHGTPKYFFPRLIYFAWMQMQSRIRRTTACLENDNVFEGEEMQSFSMMYAKVLINQLLQTRRSDYVVEGLMQRFGENSNASSLFDNEDVSSNNSKDDHDTNHDSASLSSFLISLKLRARDMSSFILALLQYANSSDFLTSSSPSTRKYLWFHSTNCEAILLCKFLFHSSPTEHQEIITEQLLFSSKASSSSIRNGNDIQEKDQRRWSRYIVETIAPSPSKKSDGDSMELFSSRLSNIADRWSQLTFVQDVAGRLQHHVSLVLWYALKILERSSISLHHPDQRLLTGAVVNGVSHRLGSILPIVRQDGMRMAQQLAKGLGQDGVQFDEFVDDDDSDCEERESIGDGSSNDKIEKSYSKPQNETLLNPDADYDSDMEADFGKLNNDQKEDSESDEASVEWKDELMPYDLEDDEEDLRTTPQPLHLLEALDLLRTGENHDHAFARHEAALEALPSLIQKRPDDLADVAVSLVLELLRMEDKFNIEGFNTKRESAIRTLLIEESLSVGQTLIEQLFEESGLTDKLLVLASLQTAALELSGNKALLEDSKKEKNLLNGQHDPQQGILSQANQLSRILSKTRRKRSRVQPKAIKNQFANTAPMWFYSLIAGFIKHRDNEVLWTGSTGSILLAYFLRCLATIVEFSGPQASQILANDLLDLVWDFRTADVPEVRLSALLAVSTSIAMISNERLISLLFERDYISKTMLEMSQRDPDKECRSLCQTISLSIHEVLKSSNF